MTLPRFYDLVEYWRGSPPTHVIMAARYGIKPKEKAEKTGDGFQEFLDGLSSAGVQMVK